MNTKYTWLMTFSEFDAKFRTQNSKQYSDDYFRLGQKHCVGCHYYMSVSSDLEIINPFTKKNKNKKILCTIVSTGSILDVKKRHLNLLLNQLFLWVYLTKVFAVKKYLLIN